jgi:phage terminase large subunit-like protein
MGISLRSSIRSSRAGTTANKPSELSDFSVCTTWGVKKKQIDVYRKKVGYPDLKRAVREQAEKHGATVVLIEDSGAGWMPVTHFGLPAFFLITHHRSTPQRASTFLDCASHRMFSVRPISISGAHYNFHSQRPWAKAFEPG